MASNQADLRASEIREVLLREIEQFGQELKIEEVGEVLEVKDGVARIYGLTHAMASEILEITSSKTGDTVAALALNLEEDNIGAVIMGDWTSSRRATPPAGPDECWISPWAMATSGGSWTRWVRPRTDRAPSKPMRGGRSISWPPGSSCGSR
jgi:predicted house-cleaning noncanonical NTP pyrophosphatase (MazG superfamily)